MHLLAFGINHKTAPVDIREKVAFAPERLTLALQGLVTVPEINEAAILSTCNRTELYCAGNNANTSINQVIDWFSDYHRLKSGQIVPYIYKHPDNEAVRHLLRVASGLDSLVLGEPQILGQVKTAYRAAEEAGTLGSILNRLCQHTFKVAKQVRTDTAIGSSPVSVAFAAVSLAKQIFSSFEKHTALLIGAGETIELTARHLKEKGIGRIIIANRTIERAMTLAQEIEGYAIPLNDISEHLADADIVIASTGSQLPILGKGTVERAIKKRKHKPILMVDIAVPRDIEPEVKDLADVYLYTVDDLQEIIEEGLKGRREAAVQAEEIIDSQVLQFMGWMQSQDISSVIRHYRETLEQIKHNELNKVLLQLQNGGDPEEIIKRLAHNLTNKFAHTPTKAIRQAGLEGRHTIVHAAQEIFDLKNPEG